MIQPSVDASKVVLREFAKSDQADVQSLILAGLGEHWGSIDSSLNPDLEDIAASYAAGFVVVAELAGVIIGSGMLVPHADGTAEVVRMSVASGARRIGVGRLILDELRRRAIETGIRRLVLETTAAWDGVVAFYKNYGFSLTHIQDSPFGPDAHFALELGVEVTVRTSS